MKILTHSKEPRGNELITYQGEIPTHLLSELLKFKDIEITWVESFRVNQKLHSKDVYLSKELVTLTTSKLALEKLFDKRCPRYYYKPEDKIYYSKKEWGNSWIEDFGSEVPYHNNWEEDNQNKTTNFYLQQIAEQMYDLYNESEAVELREGDWHRFKLNPKNIGEFLYSQNINDSNSYDNFMVKISTALISNPNETDYEKLIQIHNQLIKDNELETFVHCAKVMSDDEYRNFIKGDVRSKSGAVAVNEKHVGWCENYKGFVSYKHIIENENRN